MEIKILQANTHRSKTADDLLSQLIYETGVNLLIISEQYKNKAIPGWYSDNLNTAAIYIPETNNIVVENYHKENGFVWVKIGSITYVSCYFTPNESTADFQLKLENLENALREINGPTVVAGDFNAKAIEWGMPTTDSRGRRIIEMAARTNLFVANEGKVPTFRRSGCIGTIPDITIVSEELLGKVNNWRVTEEYTGSDHQYILFEIKCPKDKMTQKPLRIKKWNVAKLDEELFTWALNNFNTELLTSDATTNVLVTNAMQLITMACEIAMPRKRYSKRKSVYWWTEEISTLRKKCLQLRRVATRKRRKNGETFIPESQEYKATKKILHQTIDRSKRRCWDEVINDINKNPLGYKIAMNKLRKFHPVEIMDSTKMELIVNTLFPRHTALPTEEHRGKIKDVPAFTLQELELACKSMQDKKAPGPDAIPVEALKVVARQNPNLLLGMYNKCLEEGIFPKTWKTQRLVLIPKGKTDSLTPANYRPLCMLNTAGKLLETLLKPRLAIAVERSGGLSKQQHGFRKGQSTIGAIEQVVEAFNRAQQYNQHSKKTVLLATLDVRNAFNSVKWVDILNALEHQFKIDNYLLRIIRSYLSDRELQYETSEGPRVQDVTSGAAQGSILGPDL